MDDGFVRQHGQVVAFLRGRPARPRQWGDDVERVNHYPLFTLGKALSSVERCIEKDGMVNAVQLYDGAREAAWALERLLKGNPFPLGISKNAATELKASIDYMRENLFTEEKDGVRHPKLPGLKDEVDYWEWLFETNSALRKFETIFSTEMSELATYFVPPRGIYSTAALIDFADQSFPSEIRGYVPEKARSDWKAAGRCLAFSLLSASGFHVARAVEATLEVYYQLYTGKTGTLNGWHDYLKALEGVQSDGAKPAPTNKTITELKQMKDDYRNPIMHPRVVLTENDARILFDNGESLIIAMAEEIKAIRAAGGVQGALAVVGESSIDDEIPF